MDRTEILARAFADALRARLTDAGAANFYV